MTNSIQNICVFASASNDIPEIYYKEAKELGELIGVNGYNIVYGGSRRGLMYACAEAVKSKGKDIFGVMPQKLVDLGFANPEDCKLFYITRGMRERKGILDEKSDAVVALAGGFGTLEELSEMIVQKQLGYNNKPIVILNTNHFYDKLIAFFDETIQQGFASENSRKLYYVANSAFDAITYLKTYEPEQIEAKYTTKP